MRRAFAAAFAAAAALACLAPVARASMEQFASFDVFADERDDENVLDHFLARPLDDWRDEWEGSGGGARFDQGCLSSSLWYQSNEIKTRSDVGRHTHLDIGFYERTDLEGAWQWLQIDVLHATSRFGAFGGRFRPAADKSRQDFALLWSAGDARSPIEAHVTFGIEDAFNKLWTFRSAEVGDTHYEPYRAHPFEPAIALVRRGARHRIEFSGTWLTPSRRDLVDPLPANCGTASLHGGEALARAECSAGAWTLGARFEDRQAASARTSPVAPGDAHNFRRLWSGELSAKRRLSPRLEAEVRGAYVARSQDWRPPTADATFEGIDRLATAELVWRARPALRLRAGLLHDRIGIACRGAVPGPTYGSRKESRATIGVEARFGRTHLLVVEGIELDQEPYSVTFHHDKGFLHLQTSF